MVILYAGHVPYTAHHHRALFEAYARRVRVIYLQMGNRVNPVARREPAIPAGGQVEVRTITPAFPGNRIAWISRQNWKRGVRACLRELEDRRITDRVLVVQTPALLPGLKELGADLTVYLVVDDYVGLTPSGDRPRVERGHMTCLREADLIWVVSRPLLDAVRATRPDATLTTTGVDYAAFSRAAARPPAPMIAGLPKPRIGTIGKLNDRIDWDLLATLARARPGWTFVVMGPVHFHGESTTRGMKMLRGVTNVRLLPGVAPSDVPSVMAGLDVGLVVYRPGEGTLGINPLKLYEYLAAGKPVVATPLPVFAGFGDVVRVASTVPEMMAAIEAALEESSTESRIAARQLRARDFDWGAIASARLSILEAALERRSVPTSATP